MSDNDDSPLFEEVETSAPKNEDSRLVDDTKKISLDDDKEEEPTEPEPEKVADEGLPASIPVKIDPIPSSESPKVDINYFIVLYQMN